MIQTLTNQIKNRNTNSHFVTIDVIGELVTQAQNLICSIFEIELEKVMEKYVFTGVTKLIGKIFSNNYIQKSKVHNAFNKHGIYKLMWF